MFKGYYKTLLGSVVLHGLIILLLVIYQPLSLPKLPIVKNNNKPIESYLYVKPKQEKQQIVRQTPTEIEQYKLEKVLNETPEKELKTNIEKIELESFETIPSNENELKSAEDNNVSSKFENKHVAVGEKQQQSFNPYSSLNKLTESANNEWEQEQTFEFSRKKSASMMHGSLELVPEVNVEKKLKPEEKISSYSGFDYIQKNDDGTCNLVQDLSHMGAGKWKAVQSMGCGKSKSEKAFDENMSKYMEKYIPKKKE